MAEYLSKEEIKQWRSSLEKITLEEYAARLGKVVAESRPTNDLIDIVFGNENTSVDNDKQDTNNKLSKIAERAFERERQLSHTPFSFQSPSDDKKTEDIEIVKDIKSVENTKSAKNTKNMEDIKEDEPKKMTEQIILPQLQDSVDTAEEDTLREEVDIVLKKNLTDREQVVFDYLLEHKNTTVYAKDIAILLDLPRDYIYKYIKNLRTKIDGDRLKNADKGGFILSI